jgi:hypothetical protein
MLIRSINITDISAPIPHLWGNLKSGNYMLRKTIYPNLIDLNKDQCNPVCQFINSINLFWISISGSPVIILMKTKLHLWKKCLDMSSYLGTWLSSSCLAHNHCSQSASRCKLALHEGVTKIGYSWNTVHFIFKLKIVSHIQCSNMLVLWFLGQKLF